MNPLILQVEVLTPLFLGGAEPDKCAELRAPSVKGALRFWHRAVADDYAEQEGRCFGTSAATQGQSPVALVIQACGSLASDTGWKNEGPGRLPNEEWQDLNYFGYTFKQRPNDRRYFPPGTHFSLRLIPRREREIDERVRRTWIASLWLLDTFGGLGNRSRRGFGSLEITAGWGGWTECEELPLPRADSVQERAHRIKQGLKVVRDWLGSPGSTDRPCLGPAARAVIFNQGDSDFRKALINAAWQMRGTRGNDKTLKMQDRCGRDHRQPDYTQVRDHMIARNQPKLSADGLGKDISQAPERSAFGLPLTFRSSSLAWSDPTPDNPKRKTSPEVHVIPQDDCDRFPSPIHLSLIRIGADLHPLFLRLDGPLPSGVLVQARTRGQPRGVDVPLPFPTSTVLDDFMKHVAASGQEISLR